MARHENERLKAAFEIPDTITVGARMKYFSVLGPAGFGMATEDGTYYHRLWAAAKTVITNLECEYMALDVDLEKASDPRIVKAIIWIGLQIAGVIYSMDEVPKN